MAEAPDGDTEDGTTPPSGALGFAGVPRLELDQLLAQLVDRAQDVLAAQERLRGLLTANTMIIGDLALPVVLRRIVEAATQLVGARYGALGVIAANGAELEQFIHVGIDEDTAARIGHLPVGKGLLGALIEDPRPIRLDRLDSDPRSSGFPPNHPPMASFLGVPIRVRDAVFGNLYLADDETRHFSADDEQVVGALAATAGIAIDNARLFAEAGRRQRWLEASMTITRQLLAATGEDPLALIARQALDIAEADLVTIVLPTAEGSRLMVEVAVGVGSTELIGHIYPREPSVVGRALAAAQPLIFADARAMGVPMHMLAVAPVESGMVIPLSGTSRIRGALTLGRLAGRARFGDADLAMVTAFANQAAIALELADARADSQRVAMLEDRDRIARDLHDHVIQRLFASGLTLQGMSAGLDQARASRLDGIVDEIDETIRQIRTSIFELRGHLGPQTGTVRAQVLAVVDDIAPLLASPPRVRFSGPVDIATPDSVIDDLIAVVREALSNVARHAGADSTEVLVTASTDELVLEVIDDGVGVVEGARSSGLTNMRARAEKYGGTFSIATAAGAPSPYTREHGTHLTWTIPLH